MSHGVLIPHHYLSPVSDNTLMKVFVLPLEMSHNNLAPNPFLQEIVGSEMEAKTAVRVCRGLQSVVLYMPVNTYKKAEDTSLLIHCLFLEAAPMESRKLFKFEADLEILL